MERFKFCVEFTVPDEIDLEEHRSAGADFTRDLVPNPVMESIRAAVDSDSRWTLKRDASLRPARTDPKRQHLLVWVTASAPTRDEARKTVREGVYDIVTEVVPVASFFGTEDEG